MRFWKSMQGEASRETDAFVDRLTVIANRGKASACGDTVAAEEAAQPQRQQQCFWTPEEVAAGSGGV